MCNEQGGWINSEKHSQERLIQVYSSEAKMPRTRWTFLRRTTHAVYKYKRVQSITFFRTGAVPDRQSPGWFPTSPGITGQCALTRRSRNADISQSGYHRHPRCHSTTSGPHRLVSPELLSLRIHSHLVHNNMSSVGSHFGVFSRQILAGR